MNQTILADILIIFAAAVPVAYIFHKIKLPPIIGLIATGAIIGPAGIGLIYNSERIELLAQIGVALLLFSIGLEFSLKHFGQIKLEALAGGAAQVLLTILATLGISLWCKEGFNSSLILGFAFALSSTAVVLALLSQKRWVDTPHGRIATAILIFQDVCVVLMLATIPLLSEHGGSNSVMLARAIIGAVLLIGVVLAVGKFILPQFLSIITGTRSKELFLMTIIALALGMSMLTARIGLTFALGAFLAGLMVSETDYRFHALAEIAPLRYAMMSIFFISVGMLLDINFIVNNIAIVLLLTVAVIFGKTIIATLAVMAFRYPIGVASLIGLSLSQIGEFSFIIVSIGKNLEIISPFIFNLTIAVTALTIFATPIVIHFSTAISAFLERTLPLRNWSCKRRATAIDAHKLKNHVIICGFGPLGESIGHLLEKVEIDYLVLELNPSTVRRVKERSKPVYLGDGASAEILYHSGIERARALAIAVPDYMNNIAIIKQAKALNPSIKIITRAKFKNQVKEIYAAGADIVISEELEAGIEMGRHILIHLGLDETAINEYLESIRIVGNDTAVI